MDYSEFVSSTFALVFFYFSSLLPYGF